MTRRTNKSRVTKPYKPVDGDRRTRKHGDHTHDEQWCETHQTWEPIK